MLTKDMKNMILVKMGSNGKPYFVATVQGSNRGLRLRRPDAAFVRYTTGHDKPHYPVPAIPLRVVFNGDPGGYHNMTYIDSLQYGEDDPQMVRAWDFEEWVRVDAEDDPFIDDNTYYTWLGPNA